MADDRNHLVLKWEPPKPHPRHPKSERFGDLYVNKHPCDSNVASPSMIPKLGSIVLANLMGCSTFWLMWEPSTSEVVSRFPQHSSPHDALPSHMISLSGSQVEPDSLESISTNPITSPLQRNIDREATNSWCPAQGGKHPKHRHCSELSLGEQPHRTQRRSRSHQGDTSGQDEHHICPDSHTSSPTDSQQPRQGNHSHNNCTC